MADGVVKSALITVQMWCTQMMCNAHKQIQSINLARSHPSPFLTQSSFNIKGGAVSKAYGTALSIPGFGTFSNRRTYIIDPQKIVRWVFMDVESRIPKHPSEVLEKLKELQQV